MRFEYFSFQFEKKTIFFKIIAKSNFILGGGGRECMIILEWTGRRMTKLNITFSVENRILNTVFKFFPQKHLYRLN